jgi:hypothetical protein
MVKEELKVEKTLGRRKTTEETIFEQVFHHCQCLVMEELGKK